MRCTWRNVFDLASHISASFNNAQSPDKWTKTKGFLSGYHKNHHPNLSLVCRRKSLFIQNFRNPLKPLFFPSRIINFDHSCAPHLGLKRIDPRLLIFYLHLFHLSLIFIETAPAFNLRPSINKVIRRWSLNPKRNLNFHHFSIEQLHCLRQQLYNFNHESFTFWWT